MSIRPGGSSDGIRSIAFGVPPLATDDLARALVDSLSAHLTQSLGMPVVVRPALSYDSLAESLKRGVLHAGWLPPTLYVELDRSVGMRLVVASERPANVGYYAAFITRIDSDVTCVEQVPGHSIAWVSPTSGTGYLYPRLQLASHGIDPTTAFQEEVFFRSHEGVVRALLDRAVDVAATFVHIDPKHSRKVIRAGWRPGPPDVDCSAIQWLEPFGPLPADVIATTMSVPAALARRLGQAFLSADAVDGIREAAQRHFGTGRFMRATPRAYDILRSTMDAAEGKGVEILMSLRPSLPT